MGQGDPGHLILVGFSMSGKSTVGRLLAQRLGYAFVDTDDEVVQLAGKPVAEIFREAGEEHFRDLESQALARACRGSRAVIATGGGIVLQEENWRLMRQGGVVVCLEVGTETVLARLRQGTLEGGQQMRPLLQGDDSEERIRTLKAVRAPLYAQADWTVHTEYLTPSEVAAEVLRGLPYAQRRHRGTTAGVDRGAVACEVYTASGSYPVVVAWHALGDLGRWMRGLGLAGTAMILSDAQVFALYGPLAESVLLEAGFAVASFSVPPGEQSKSLASLGRIYDWLLEQRVERNHPVVALGGGMVGDLAGFAAATMLRGLPLVQVPTTLLAMVDASIGGKTAVNHPKGKNLIGAFYQPRLVLADPATLATLPQRELAEGWTELIKHALILDEELFSFLETHQARLKALEEGAVVAALRASAALKGQVVSADEREEGLRTLLNYGHTIGHALEAATDYGHFLHGEAVAIGMMGAARISQRMGLINLETVERQQALLEAFGLPLKAKGIPLGRLREAMALDKKIRQGTQRWVLLEGVGRAVVRDDVPVALVEEVLQDLLA